MDNSFAEHTLWCDFNPLRKSVRSELPNRSARFKVALPSNPPGEHGSVAYHRSSGLADLAADHRFDRRAGHHRRARLVPAAQQIVPRDLLPQVAQEVKQKGVTQDLLNRLVRRARCWRASSLSG